MAGNTTQLIDDITQKAAELARQVNERASWDPEPDSPMGRKLAALQGQLDAMLLERRRLEASRPQYGPPPPPPPTPNAALSPERQRLQNQAQARGWLDRAAAGGGGGGEQYGPVPPPQYGPANPGAYALNPNPQLSGQRADLKQLYHLTGNAPAGVGKQDWQEALARVEQQLYEEKQRQLEAAKQKTQDELTQRAYAARTGQIHPDAITAAPGVAERVRGAVGPTGLHAASITAGLLRQYAQQGAHPSGNPAAGLSSAIGAFSALPGPIGVFAQGLSLAASAAGYVVSSFYKVRDSAESMIQEQHQLLSDLRSGRQSGVSTGEQLRRSLTAPEQSALAHFQQAGDRTGMESVLASARQRLEADSAQAGGAARVAAAQAALERIERVTRSTPYRLSPGAPGPAYLRRQALRDAGVPDEEIGELSNEAMTPAQIRQAAELAGGRGVRAQAGLQALRNALRPGGMPNLAPGAPDLSELPGIFRSRQADVLDVHSQIQQEAVRDQRQQAQFEAQMRLWTQIQTDIARLAGQPQPPAPVS